MLRKLYFKIFKRYRVLETVFVTWEEGDKMLRETHNKPESERWQLSEKEDENSVMYHVFLCRKERITN